MGVVNVTPDSFSDGGAWLDPQAAVAHGRELAAAGADIVDVGGESTRPGAQRISRGRGTAPGHPGDHRAGRGRAVRQRGHDAGGRGAGGAGRRRGHGQRRERRPGRPRDGRRGRARPGFPTWSCTGAGTAPTCTSKAVYGDVVAEVRAELGARVADVIAAGVDPAQIIVDPGLGFAKRAEHNWALLAALPRLARLPGLDAGPVPGAGRRLPQELHRPPAGRPGRHAPAVRRQRRRDGRAERAERRGRRLVRAGPRGARQRRRRAGRRALGAAARPAAPGWAGRDEPGPDLPARAARLRPARRARARARRGPGVRHRRRARDRHPARPRPPTTWR